jgi:hypothetical protein
MATLKIRIRDIQSGKLRLRSYRGPAVALRALKDDIAKDRKSHHPPGTAIHTPVPAGITPAGFVPSFLVVDPMEITED